MVCKFNWVIAGNNFLRLLKVVKFERSLGLYMV
jgi:hypothetical protein